jgi:ferredoxin-type protein NapH
MSEKICQADSVRGPLSVPPRPGESTAGSKARKANISQVRQVRRVKQSVMGIGFMLLLAAGWIYPLLGYFIPVCMLLGIGLAIFKGRSWCDWYCPRGSFEDSMLAKISRGVRIPAVFRGTPLRVGIMTFLMGMLTWQIIRLWPDPRAIGAFFVLLLSITTTAGVVLGMVYQQRLWCYLCPIGTMSNWVGKNRQPLVMKAESCKECNVCARQCPMQLSPMELKQQDAMSHRGDCLKCSLCVASCPTAALSFQKAA